MMKSFFSFFRRLQWKLTLSYAVVTTGTVVVLAAALVMFALLAENMNSTRVYDSLYWSKTGFQDNIPYLMDDPALLQTWLERVQVGGFNWMDFQSNTVGESLDYANSLKRGYPVYVLDPDLNLLAAAPLEDSSVLGKPFKPREIGGLSIETILEEALTGSKFYNAQSLEYPDGSRIVAFPLRKSDDEPVSAIVIYQVRPLTFVTPTHLDIYATFLAATAAIMVVIALPVGAFFGWLVTFGLRRRLSNLSAASKAWSKGDFSVFPRDRSGDEIGELTRNLNDMAEQLRSLLQTNKELARVEERNRLARDLHDTVKQQTYAARMQLTAARNLVANNPQAAAGHIEDALQLNRETQQELGLIIDELRPAALEGKGLAQALLDYTTRWQAHTGIAVKTNLSGERALPLNVEQALYRVLQESLSNVARHAEADAVEVALQMTPDQVSMTVTDNGCGFDPQAVPASSLGLAGMKQRLAEVNGALVVESKPNAGAKIAVTVNLRQK